MVKTIVIANLIQKSEEKKEDAKRAMKNGQHKDNKK